MGMLHTHEGITGTVPLFREEVPPFFQVSNQGEVVGHILHNKVEELADSETVMINSHEKNEPILQDADELVAIMADLPQMLSEASHNSTPEVPEEENSSSNLKQYLENLSHVRCSNRIVNGYSDTPDILYDHISRWAQILLGAEVNTTALRELVRAAFVAADNRFGSAAAVAWGERNFPEGIPPAIVKEHLGLLRAAGGVFEEMARIRLASLHDKTVSTDEKTRYIDMIGYRVNLEYCTLSISERNSLRAIYVFFSFDVDKKVPVRQLEKMTSLASRYALICPVLRPFIHALYGAYVGISNRNCSVSLKPDAKRAILMWRVTLCTLSLREQQFARPFLSFRKVPAQWIVQFDASLKRHRFSHLEIQRRRGR